MKNSSNPLAIQSQNRTFTALETLLAARKYHDITVGMICHKAEIDRRTFYRYFENKEDVLASYFDRLFDEYTEQMARAGSAQPLDFIRLFFVFWGNCHGELFIALIQQGLLNQAFNGKKQYLKAIGRQMDRILGRTSTDYELSFRAGGLVNALALWISRGQQETPDEIAAIIAGILH